MKTNLAIFTLSMMSIVSLPASATHSPFIGASEEYPTGHPSISQSGLIASYDFETLTKQGKLKDLSGNSLHGSFEQPAMVQGQYGKARAFVNKEDVVLLPNDQALSLLGPMTVAAKVKITQANLHQHLLACNDLFVLWLTTENKYRFADTLGQGITTIDSIAPVEEGQWHSVVATLSATQGDNLNQDKIKIYVNGQEMPGKFENQWKPTKMADKNACVIGGTRTGHQHHQDLQFEGILDDLQVYSRALSKEEVMAYSAQ